MPPAPMDRIESAMTCPTPVHSTMMSGSNPTPATVPVVGRAEGAHQLGFGPRLDPVENVDLQPVLLPR